MRQAIGLLFMISLAGMGHAATFRLGVEPFLSPRMLVQSYAPMARGLEPVLGRSVEIATGTQPVHFVKRALQGDFDLVIAPPPIAAYLAFRQQFSPVAYLRNDFFALVLVPRQSSARALTDLKGRQIHLANTESYVTDVGRDFLAQAGVSLERDLRTVIHPSENSALLASLEGRQDAVLVSRAVYERMPDSIRDELRVLGSTRSAVSQVVMAHTRLGGEQVEAVKRALQSFMYTQEGNRWFLKQGVTLTTQAVDLPVDVPRSVAIWQSALQRAGVSP